MAIENENEEVEQQEVEQQKPQGEEVSPHASTGDAVWDKLIDDVAGTGAQNVKKPDRAPAADTNKEKPATQQQAGDEKTNTPAQQRQEPTQDTRTQQTPQIARKYGNLFQAATDGHIYDTNGGLIAKSGMQRSIFHRIYPTIEAQERELTGLRSKIQNYEQSNEIAKREGLGIDEHGAALQMFAAYKKDPVKTLNTLLTLAEQSGKDISTIKQSTGPSIADFRAAVAEEVANAVKPFTFLTAQQEQQQEQQELLSQVQQNYAAFIEEFPDARTHEQAIANVMRDRQVSEREAYYMIRAFASEKQLDWTKPLAEQLIGQDQQQRNPSGVGQNRRQIPVMNGRGRSEQTHVPAGARDQANAEDSWDSIARNAMRTHGIEID